MRHLLILSSLLLSLASARLIAQSEPPLIPFQGRLTDQTGQLVSNGVFSVVFQLYTSPVGGDILWSERHERVGVINGMVNVFLGSISPLTSIDFGATRHLGITVDIDQNPNTPDVEMVPRQMIIPAFSARQAERTRTMDVLDANGRPVPGQSYGWSSLFTNGNPATGSISGNRVSAGSIDSQQIANSAIRTSNIADGQITQPKLANGIISSNQLSKDIFESLVPPGSIIAYGGTQIPSGWLLCDGRTVNQKDYPRLWAAIGTKWNRDGIGELSQTFQLPDLRGLFLRGVDDSPATGASGRDPDRATRTDASGGGVRPNAVGSYQGDAAKKIPNVWLWEGVEEFGGKQVGPNYSGRGSTQKRPVEWPQADETRPRNAYVYYIIRH